MQRLRFEIRGIVQGVGFRPFVYGLATRLHLRGFVANQTAAWRSKSKASRPRSPSSSATCADRRRWRASSDCHAANLVRGDADFRIVASAAAPGAAVFVSPDAATCDDCLAELFDPGDRRYRYPFLNCTNCGPRLTIVTGAPTIARKRRWRGSRCARPAGPSTTPGDRRFHAQPTACPPAALAPALDADGRGSRRPDRPAARRGALAGQIGALKGLGGYHLACDAGQPRRRSPSCDAQAPRREAVRRHGRRPGAAADGSVRSPSEEAALLPSPRRPIVLLPQRGRRGRDRRRSRRAPRLGVMLPYTPLHHLLLRAVGGRPLVMTSGNRSDEPIAYRRRRRGRAARAASPTCS